MVAPAGPFPRPAFAAGLAVLRTRYEVVHTDAIFSQSRYLAGDDEVRLGDLVRALGDPSTLAVFCARGGYGAMRLLDRVDPEAFPPKLLVGFSDITAFHLAWQAKGRVSIHGPVVTQLGRAPANARERLFSVLEGTGPAGALAGTATYVPGAVEGPLVGGNMSVLTRLLGTRFMPSLDGAVLLLEDVGERPYRFDRMWMHLKLSGALDRVAGVCLGEFSGCEEADASYSGEDVRRDMVAALGRPCAGGFRIGHDDENLAVPLGVRVRLDADSKTLTFLESTCAPEGVG